MLSKLNLGARAVIAIEGNIGAGKSTLMAGCARQGLQLVEEPLMQWQSLGPDGKINLLEKFYDEPKRWAFTFQTYAVFTRAKATAAALRSDKHGPLVLERRQVAPRILSHVALLR